MHRVVIVAAVVLAALAGLGAPAAPARAAGGNVWITLGTATPGIGCSVGVAVEVRSGGEAVAGVPVEIALFSGTDVLSSDSATTDGDGVAQLAFDASTGADWLDIDVDGAYAGGTGIAASGDGACDGDPVELTASLDVAIPAGEAEAIESGFPTHVQEHGLSCEYASLQIATAALGDPVPEDAFLADVPFATDPHLGFRGDIDGAWGNTDDYGVYAEPLAAALADYGFAGEVWYDASADALATQLDAGNPTLLWIATRGDTGFYAEDDAGNTFKLVPYEHVVVALAYDDSGVYVSDPGTGMVEHLSWGWLLDAWSVLDGMALSVSA